MVGNVHNRKIVIGLRSDQFWIVLSSLNMSLFSDADIPTDPRSIVAQVVSNIEEFTLLRSKIILHYQEHGSISGIQGHDSILDSIILH